MRLAWVLIILLFTPNAFAESFQCGGADVSVEYKQMDPPSASGWERVTLKANKDNKQIARQYEYVHFKIGCWTNPKGKQYIVYQAYCGGSASYCNHQNNWGIIDPAVTQALLDPSPENRPKAEKVFGGQLRWERWDEEAGAQRHIAALNGAGQGPPHGSFTGATLSVDGKSIIYRAAPEGAPFAQFQFETKGYRNTYSLDCSRRQFLWTSNIELATGQSTINAAGAEWRPITGDSKVAQAVFSAICSDLSAQEALDETFPEPRMASTGIVSGGERKEPAVAMKPAAVASGPSAPSANDLVEASAVGDLARVNQLIEKGADANAPSRENGDTALSVASEKGHFAVVQTLLANGAEPNVGKNFTPLMIASMAGHRDIVQALVAKGADVNAVSFPLDWTALMLAARAGQGAIVETLVAHGADLQAKDKEGKTAGDLASEFKHDAIAKSLRSQAAQRGRNQTTSRFATGTTGASGNSAAGNPPADRVELKDGSVLTAPLPNQKVKFNSSFGAVELDLNELRAFADRSLSLVNGTVLKGTFGEGKLALATGVGRIEVAINDIVAITRSGSPAIQTSLSVPAAKNDAPTEAEIIDLIRKANQFPLTEGVYLTDKNFFSCSSEFAKRVCGSQSPACGEIKCLTFGQAFEQGGTCHQDGSGNTFDAARFLDIDFKEIVEVLTDPEEKIARIRYKVSYYPNKCSEYLKSIDKKAGYLLEGAALIQYQITREYEMILKRWNEGWRVAANTFSR